MAFPLTAANVPGCSVTSHTQYGCLGGPHLLSRNAVGGAARLVSNFGNDRSAAGFAKKGKCRPCWPCLDYFDFFLHAVFGFTTFLQIVRPQQTPQPCRRTWAPNPGPSTKMIMSYTRWLVCGPLPFSSMYVLPESLRICAVAYQKFGASTANKIFM